jgi:hypothetical protein
MSMLIVTLNPPRLHVALLNISAYSFPVSLNLSTKCMFSIFQVPTIAFAAAVSRLRLARHVG